jgi:hypothetical protein
VFFHLITSWESWPFFHVAGKIMIGTRSWVIKGDYDGRPNLIWRPLRTKQTDPVKVFYRRMTNFLTYEVI